MGEAVELGSLWTERCSRQSAEGSGCPAGKPSANGTWVVEKTRWKAACTLEGQWTHCTDPPPTSYT